MISTLMAVVTIDRWGRRFGLYWGAIGQGISLILAGAFARLLKDHPEKASQYGGAAAFFVFMYTAIFGATWLTIPWVRTSCFGTHTPLTDSPSVYRGSGTAKSRQM